MRHLKNLVLKISPSIVKSIEDDGGGTSHYLKPTMTKEIEFILRIVLNAVFLATFGQHVCAVLVAPSVMEALFVIKIYWLLEVATRQ